MTNKVHLSLVIPAYNEEEIIGRNLETVINYLKKKKYSWEIVLVSDGSTDKTVEIARKFKGVNVYSLPQNMGKGAALRKGVLSSNGEYVVFTDADLSVPIEYLDDILESLKNYDLAIASRRTKGARIVKHQPFIRENLGKMFTKMTQILLQSNVKDFTCGFKGFRSEAGKKVFAKGVLNRWAYDAEIIFLAQKYKYSVKEVPIIWENRVETRVRVGNAIIESFFDLFRIKINNIRGVYEN